MNLSAVAWSDQGDGQAAKEFKFEVLSIHPVKRGPGVQIGLTNPTSSGFTATAGMWQLLEFAYGPPAPAGRAAVWQSTEIRHEPGWVNEEIYAIDARVSQADLKAWQNQNPNTHDLLHSALRAALRERFRLACKRLELMSRSGESLNTAMFVPPVPDGPQLRLGL